MTLPNLPTFRSFAHIFRGGMAKKQKYRANPPRGDNYHADNKTKTVDAPFPFDFRHTGRFKNDCETRVLITRFSTTSSASSFVVQATGATSLSIEGRIRSNAKEMTMRTGDGHEIIRLYPTHDRRRQIVHMYDSRDLCYYTMCKSDVVVRKGYQTVLVWKGEDGIGEPKWQLHVKPSEKYAKVQDMASGGILLVVDQRFAKLRKWTSGQDSKRLRIMAHSDMAMMTMLAAGLEDICDETFGRNLEFAADLGDRMIITERD